MCVAEAGAVVAEAVAEAVNNFLSTTKEKKNKTQMDGIFFGTEI